MSNYPAALDDLTAVQDDHGADATAAWFLPAASASLQAPGVMTAYVPATASRYRPPATAHATMTRS